MQLLEMLMELTKKELGSRLLVSSPLLCANGGLESGIDRFEVNSGGDDLGGFGSFL